MPSSCPDVVYQYYYTTPGHLHPREAEVLWRLARRSEVVLEIGCFKGLSTGIFLLADPKLVISCDTFQNCSKKFCEINIRLLIHDNNHEFVVGKSQKVSEDIVRIAEAIDLLFIDGDHSTRAVRTDTELYLPLIRVGGYAAYHDCRKESVKVVTMTIPENWNFEHVRTVENLVIFRRYD